MGTANAEPVPAPAEGIKYSVKLVDKTVVATIKNGTFSIVEQDGETPEAPKTRIAEIKDTRGDVVISLPVAYAINGTEIPTKAEVVNDATVLQLTPERPAGVDIAATVVSPKPVLKGQEIASAQENQKAINDFSSKFSIGTAIGTFVGTAIGAVIGCVVTIPVGCLPGLTVGAAAGGIIGMIAIGGPTMAVTGWELLQVLQAPDGTTVWADKPKPAS
ncbi:hypothetical protein ACFVAV_21265 [Nocardia sp. NPDC057663]|uniref:hypothetical protein n=1 Tax=Nocardia sp. NPDC057663 TaxID=3346201 RepID=UPI00366D158A